MREAIDYRRDCLRRIVAAIAAMAGLGMPGRRALARPFYLSILRLLRPAEAAARRLIIASARGLVVVLPARPAPKHRPKSAFLRGTHGTGIVLPPELRPKPAAPAGPKPFPLSDPARCPVRPRVNILALPRISAPGVMPLSALPERWLPADPVDTACLGHRLVALTAALDDLPGQALRFARRQALRAAQADRAGRPRRSPLRSGLPPGTGAAHKAFSRRRSAAQPDFESFAETLSHAHALALSALRSPDTS